MTKLQRTKRLNKIITQMGGAYNGHNAENYARVAAITHSSVQTVKSWMTNPPQRIIPEIKLQALINTL